MGDYQVVKEHTGKGSTTSAIDQLGIEQEQLSDAQLLDHPSYIELQKKLTDSEAKATENWDRALRTQAEMDNMQRRVERDIANAHKFALEKFISNLLPVVDNLERALDHAKNDDLEGINMTLVSFLSALQKVGVEQVNPKGDLFNPEFHQAVATQADDTIPPGTVLVVMQKGYLLNGRLMRPALVTVSKEHA